MSAVHPVDVPVITPASSVKPAANGVSSSKQTIDLNAFYAALMQLASSDANELSFARRISDVVISFTHPILLLECRTADPSQPDQRPEIRRLHGNLAQFGRTGAELCLQGATKAINTGRSFVLRSTGSIDGWLAAVPMPNRPGEVILALYPENASPQSVTALQMASSHLAISHAQQLVRRASIETTRLAELADLVARLETADDIDQASAILADTLQRHFQCTQVVVGTCEGDSTECVVTAISETPSIDANSDLVRASQAVLQESIARGELSAWPALSPDDRHALCAHRQFVETTSTEALLSVVLRDDLGVIHGAWLMCGPAKQVHVSDAVAFAFATQRPIASTFRLLRRSQRNRLVRAWERICRAASTHKGRSLTVLGCLALGSLGLPVRYHVHGKCELQPVTQRYIAAPFECRLEKAFVAPGDIVKTGQLLAQLDGQDIRWELAGTEADLHRATKELAGYQVSHETGKADIAQQEVERLTMRAELLKHRVSHLDIHSPIDGMVILGDLKRSAGMPLSTGQTLIEIAPLDKMVVEVAIPEDDVRFVDKGLSVTIWLDSFPMESWEAQLTRVHPRAEVKHDENVFIAEVPLDNREARFRPGMSGTAKVTTVRKPLGWNLFHKPLAAVLRWLGW